MGEDLIRYDLVVQNALRQAVREVLYRTAKEGLPGEHHFFITFMTGAPGVKLSPKIKAKYPDEMTIVLQHQYWELRAEPEHFEVKLSFNNVTEHLVVPYAAIKTFVDPSVEFALQFGQHEGEPAIAPNTAQGDVVTEKSGAATALTKTGDAPATAENQDHAHAAIDGDSEAEEQEGRQAEIVQLDAFRKKS